jgi:hypothetical protein
MTAPRAAGAHATYPSVPEPVRAWVDRTLGSPVIAVAEQQGGMSPGCATNLPALQTSRHSGSARFLAAARRRLDLRR